jgi:histidinol-phosphate aminotransferase
VIGDDQPAAVEKRLVIGDSETATVDEAFFAGLAQPAIRGLKAYDPGHDLVALRRRFAPRALAELGSNENPHGPSPRVRAALSATFDELHRYPDPRGGNLKRTLAALHGVAEAQLLLGNGSHELLMQFGQAFAGPDAGVLMSQFGFAVYAIAAMASGAPLVQAPALPRGHAMARGHDLEALAASIGADTRLVYLANPNNPTGTWFGAEAFAAFMARVPREVLVVVDEAYAEFADAPGHASALPLLRDHPNLVVTRTFSKAYALAGVRAGYAIAHPGLVAVMERLRESFNLNMLALAAAEAALGDEAHLREGVRLNAMRREALAAALQDRGWFVYPSQTNFLLVEFGAGTDVVEAQLREAGVVVRPMGGYGLGECLRITVGDDDGNRRLLEALDAVSSTVVRAPDERR